MYTCGRYQIYKACTAHYLRRSVIEKIVLDEIWKVCRLAQGNGVAQENGVAQGGNCLAQTTGAAPDNDSVTTSEQITSAEQVTSSEQITSKDQLTSAELTELTSLLRRKLHTQETAEKVTKEKEISELKGRLAEIDSIINGLYEDKVRGVLSSERFAVMLGRYENEQKELRENLEKLRTEIKETRDKDEAADHFIRLIKETTCPEELTEELVGNLIDRVEVGEAYYEDGKKKQDIKILFNFVGKIEWDKGEWNAGSGTVAGNVTTDDVTTDNVTTDNVAENSVYEIEGGRRPKRK